MITATPIPARKHWLSAESAARYRRSRAPDRFGRYWREEAQMVRWVQDLPRNARILDVACGAGRWIPTLAGRGFEYAGIDISPAMVQEARSQTNPPQVLGFVVGDAVTLPLADASVDCVILWRFLHHIASPATRQRILAEAARVSRRRVIISFHHVLSLTYLTRFVIPRNLTGFAQDGRGCTARQIRREAERCGLEAAEFASFGKYRSINWFARLEKRRELISVRNIA